MAYTIELDTQHFEPVRLEFVQGSCTENITFAFNPGRLPIDPSAKLWYRDPFGILNQAVTLTPHLVNNGAIFIAEIGTFIFPGVYTGAIEVINNNDADEVYFSFPFRFHVYENTRYAKWTRRFPDTVMASGASETISTAVGGYSLTALGDTIAVLAGGEAYLLLDNGSVSVYGSNVTVAYDQSNDLITITNTAGDATIPQIDFIAYDESPVGVKMVYPTPLPILA